MRSSRVRISPKARRRHAEVVKASDAHAAKLAQAKFAASGITTDLQQELGYHTLTPAQCTKAKVRHAPYGAIELRNYDPRTGTLIKFKRWRRLWPEDQPKPPRFVRYHTQKGERQRPHFPHLPTRWPAGWVETIASQKRCALTEGELKAACGCAYLQELVIGIAGVSSVGSRKRGFTIAPEIRDLLPEGTRIDVCFDTPLNPEATAQLQATCRTLAAAGYVVHVVTLRAVEGLDKTGLDDALMHYGAEEVQPWFDDAPLWTEATDLAAFDRHYCACLDPVVYVSLESIQMWKYGEFKDTVVSTVSTLDAEGDAVPLFGLWNGPQHPRRNTVQGLTYRPLHFEQIAGRTPDQWRYVEENGRRLLNIWPGYGCAPREGKYGGRMPTVMQDILDFVIPDTAVQNWLKPWWAYPLQHAGTKLTNGVLIWSHKQGPGKSTVGGFVEGIYGKNYTVIEKEHLINTMFNEWQMYCQYAMGEEVTGDQQRDLADRMKNMITLTTIWINRKNIKAFPLPHLTNYYLNSNHSDPLNLEPSDRRWMVYECKQQTLLPDALRREYYGNRQRLTEEFFAYLLSLSLDVAIYDPFGSALQTDDRTDLIRAGQSTVERWVDQLRLEPAKCTTDPLYKNRPAADRPVQPYTLATAEDLRHWYNLTLPDDSRLRVENPSVMGKAMGRAEFLRAAKGAQIRMANGQQQRLWIIRAMDAAKEEEWPYPSVGVPLLAGQALKLYNQERETYKKERATKKYAEDKPPKPVGGKKANGGAAATAVQ